MIRNMDGHIETVSSSSFLIRSSTGGGGGDGNATTSSPSSLEKQYAFPLGQRLILGIQVNAACCLEGGVETILKQLKKDRSITTTTTSTMMTTNQSSSYRSIQQQRMVSNHHNASGFYNPNKNNSNNNQNGDFDAFAFLQEDDPQDRDVSVTAYKKSATISASMPSLSLLSPPSSLSSSSSQLQQQQPPPRPSLGGFLKKMVVHTGAQLEQSMQNLAVKIDQGKNPDLLRVAMYDPITGELLDVTETRPLVLSSSSSSSSSPPDTVVRTDIRFALPLTVPGSRRQQQILLKLWIQSGAALLQSTRGLLAQKNYLLGSAIIDCMKLVVPGFITLPLTSAIIVGGQIQLCVTPDPKFGQLFTRGWSVTDPDMSGYTSTLNHLPLDQSYIFPGKQSHHWLIAQERATESTITLPIATAMMDLAGKATEKSFHHAMSISRQVQENRHDHKDIDHKATCTVGIVGVIPHLPTTSSSTTASATITISWRRPDSIFELEIVANEPLPMTSPNVVAGFPAVKHTFYPKLVTEHVLPGILQAYGGQMPTSGFLLGGLHFCVAVVQTTTSTTTTDPPNHAQIELWETVIGMESFITDTTESSSNNNNNNTIQVPLHKHKDCTGHLLLQIQVTLPTVILRHYNNNNTTSSSSSVIDKSWSKIIPPEDGLVSLVGMDSLSHGLRPGLDVIYHSETGDSSNSSSSPSSMREKQLHTMGYFMTTQYLEQQLSLRKSAWETFQERSNQYKQALMQPERTPSHTLKSPKNFRPSSSRPTALLSGIPFNVHVASLNVNVMDSVHHPKATAAGGGGVEYPGASFHNVTCGAPADHAQGFGNILAGSSGCGGTSNTSTDLNTTMVSGGLRRLESKRIQCAHQLQQAQSLLIAGVGNYLLEARKTGGALNHIPARHAEIQRLRWRVFDCAQSLYHITWMCAVRRVNVFSQSLGLAVTSYLASVSDRNKCAAGWPDLWRKHGFMVCFEGLLSAAGKELGMIEDASVAIAMLRMVRIVLMPDHGIPSRAIYIPSSPFLKWVNIFASGEGSTSRHFLLQIGVDPVFYTDRVPAPLQNNHAVQLYPLLFEVGVDVRQWGAHTGANLMRNGSQKQMSEQQQQQQVIGGLVEDEDDDVGVVDDDVLVALNYEALQKMNCYAHAISPQDVLLDKVQNAAAALFSSSTVETWRGTNPTEQLAVHPSLSTLHAHVLSSAGKMNHSILDEAATLAQQLGGGGVVFCKSGKDRTAMHVTYKQAQFAARYRDNNDPAAILEDANLIRIHGTRLPICEKNVGQAKYAFNSLQVKFMPEALKPPMSTLAGFLKGGEIFRSGGIES